MWVVMNLQRRSERDEKETAERRHGGGAGRRARWRRLAQQEGAPVPLPPSLPPLHQPMGLLYL